MNIAAGLAPYINPETTRESSLAFSLIYDTRDIVYDPTRGIFNAWSFMDEGGYLGGDENFLKGTWDLRAYKSASPFFGWNWLKRLTLGLRGQVGVAQGYPGGRGYREVPANERFFLGGNDGVRGYRDDTLGASEMGGGRFMLLTNTELGFRPWKPLRLYAFYDSGNTWDDITSVNWDRLFLYSSVGWGFNYYIPKTELQIRWDVGYPLVDLHQGAYQIQFFVGNVF
jgi:outer membrane protein insertion porin family